MQPIMHDLADSKSICSIHNTANITCTYVAIHFLIVVNSSKWEQIKLPLSQQLGKHIHLGVPWLTDTGQNFSVYQKPL